MSILIQNKQILITIIGSLVAALFVYSFLSYLFITPKIAIPACIITSILIFGLTRYYDTVHTAADESKNGNLILKRNSQNEIQDTDHNDVKGEMGRGIFIVIFAASILICSLTFGQQFHIFIKWNEIGISGAIQLAAAILLCFFIPGYAIIDTLSKKYTISRVIAVLLSYLLSILIASITAYISSLSFDNAISESKYLFIAIYLAILAFYLLYDNRGRIAGQKKFEIKKYSCYFLSSTIIKYLEQRTFELIVFGSLVALIIVATYVVYGGITVGDQWYHQGRTLLFLSGSIREAILSKGEVFYPPFQSALLASLTALSGIPLVNAYASIAFLNATIIFAFYYFFKAWIPVQFRSAALLASVLFCISSGFGWTYVLYSATNHSIASAHSSLEIFESLRGLDVVDPANYVISASPEFSTSLIYIALPAGFVLLGLVRACRDTKFNISIVTAISVLGILSHYEFYLFIIIASLLPVIFKMKAKSSLYCSFLIAISIVYLVNVSTPGNFYVSLEIFGIPLLFLTALFVTIAWLIYIGSGPLIRFFSGKFFSRGSINTGKTRKSHCWNTRLGFITSRTVIFLIAYFYLLSFIILGQLSTNTIRDQTSFGTVPWYTYPIKLGVVGFLGLAFILSYFFKKYENQIFIFGIIIIVSLIVSPYYNESRFSKYVMIGAVGFASLMIYKFLNLRVSNNNNSLRNILIICIIIPASGISIFLYMGYSSYIVETHDFTPPPSRRNFPSDSELDLLEKLHGIANVESNKYNVISFSNQYDRWKNGFMEKIPSFSGLPYDKLRQSPLDLNASTLESLYYLLAQSDARYILVPKDSIKASSIVTDPTRFVVGHFKPVYKDDNYSFLEIPSLVPPDSSSNAKVGLVYNQSDDLAPVEVSDTGLLRFDNNSFDLNGNEKSVTTEGDNRSQMLNMFGAEKDKGITIWSKTIPVDKKVNYFETSFQIVPGNKNKNNSGSTGVKWQEADKQYYAKLSNEGIGLYQISKNGTYKEILIKNADTEKKISTWYAIRVENLDNSTKIYLNDVLKIEAPRFPDNKTQAISNIGLITNHNDVQFKPLKIGSVSDYSQNIRELIKNYNYYSLSLLALTKASYDVFSDSDSSVFSRNVILVPDSVVYDNITFQKYADYIRHGGTLILVHSQNNSNTFFNHLFSLKSNASKEQSFTNIADNKNQKHLINVSGFVDAINVTDLPDIDIIASYRNNKNETIAPFIIEKGFPGGGKIILLNSNGYFNSISKSPTRYFSTLSNISLFLPVDIGKGIVSKYNSAPSKAFTGKMEANGKISLNSSSISLRYEDNNPVLINASRIEIFNGTNLPFVIKNLSIKGLKIMGDYAANIDFSGALEIPGRGTAGDYIGVDLPTGINMTVKASPKGFSHIEILTQNKSSTKSIIISNYSTIIFNHIKPESPAKTIPLLMKRPEIKIDGHVAIKNTYFDGFLNERGRLISGAPLELQGHLDSKIELVDKLDQPYRNSTRTSDFTYLKTLVMNGSFSESRDGSNLLQDVYFKAKQTVQDIQLNKVLTSTSNFILIIILIPTVIIIGEIICRNKKL